MVLVATVWVVSVAAGAVPVRSTVVVVAVSVVVSDVASVAAVAAVSVANGVGEDVKSPGKNRVHEQ